MEPVAQGKIFMVSLGCPKNRVDTEHMMGLLQERGFSMVSRPAEADTAVVNTCGFIRSAVEEAVDTILELVEEKRRGLLKRLIVAGCLVQRYGYKLAREIPEVDGWVGTGLVERLPDLVCGDRGGSDGRSFSVPFYIERPRRVPDHTVPRVPSTPFFTTYLRIAEGCSHRCSYCLIPGLRGPFRSRTLDSLLEEARRMAARGVVEVNLVAQDTTRYGKDLGDGASLEGLLEELARVREIKWIRLLYAHPEGVTERLLELLSSLESLCPYLDLPLQHVNPRILELMNRRPVLETPAALVERIRSRASRPIALRTTLMVGFPGETEARFEELCRFVKWARFEHLGVFAFSPEAGTRAARYEGRVTAQEAERRRNHILRLQAEILEERNRRMLGLTVPVLVEGPCPESDLLLQGRTREMAPEVDGRVLINKGTGVAGRLMDVRITQTHPYDLVGEIV